MEHCQNLIIRFVAIVQIGTHGSELNTCYNCQSVICGECYPKVMKPIDFYKINFICLIMSVNHVTIC